MTLDINAIILEVVRLERKQVEHEKEVSTMHAIAFGAKERADRCNLMAQALAEFLQRLGESGCDDDDLAAFLNRPRRGHTGKPG